MGKVHGSLARAGKVKSQTPKVSPSLRRIYLGSLPANQRLISLLLPTGRAAREEEDPQGSREEASPIHPTIRQRHDDRWKAEGRQISYFQ
jgi:hypothetical protein